VDVDRRWALGKLALGSLTLSGIFIGLGRWLLPDPEAAQVTGNVATPAATDPIPTPPPTKTGFVPVPGTRSEITPIEDFYRVDINLLPPGDAEFIDPNDSLLQRLLQQGGETDLPADSYVLIVDGLLKNSLALSLAEIKSYPMVEQYATLECISNPVGGDLISTTLFQGVRLKDVLETAELEAGVVDLKFTCVDGYSESLPLEAALHPETILCYAMGNKPLSKKHGAPIRLFTPDRFGLKNPKWIIRIDAIDTHYQGFWGQRGWSESAYVQTTSVSDTFQAVSAGPTMVGGIAYAGARGIQSVEVRVDEGSWIPAELDRPVSKLTWVLWRASLNFPGGQYILSVRATDGGGQVQTGKSARTHPSGATGYHSMKITI
jgi:DMSO/TMAO reductase YedYZ molybdopterin-dependent catalytic subunit